MNNSDNNRKRIKIFSILFLIFCICIIGLAIWQQVSRIGKVKIEVRYAPYTAQVEVNGKKVKNTGTIYLNPGEYEIKATQNGFDELIQNTTINESTEYIYGMLTPNSIEGEEISEKRQNDFLEVQGLYGAAAINSGEKQRAEWPIINSLPINNAIFSVGYIVNAENQFQIVIVASNTYLESAVNTLKEANHNKEIPLAEYDIVIQNFNNPFKDNFINNNSNNPLDFLRQGYSNVQCTVNEGIRDGNYYYATITTGSVDEFNIVTYRVLIEYFNNSWRLVSTPYPLLTVYNTPNVSARTLEAINNL